MDYSLGFFSFSSFTPSRPPHSSLSRRPVACALLSQNVKCFISKQILNDFLELGKFACALAIRYLGLDDDAVAMYNRITSLSFAPRLRRLHFSITISDINKYSDGGGGGGFNYKTILSSLCRVILQRANCCRPYRPLLWCLGFAFLLWISFFFLLSFAVLCRRRRLRRISFWHLIYKLNDTIDR